MSASPKARTDVTAGQCYRVPRRANPARHVMVCQLSGMYTGQPKAHYYEVTRNGKRKGPLTAHGLVRYLQCNIKGVWALPADWELV